MIQNENTTLNNRISELEKQLKNKNYLLKANIDIEKRIGN